METIQIVIDGPLLKEADQAAKKTKVNRSELVRTALRAHLKQMRVREMEEQERLAYEKVPQTKEEIHLWDGERAWLED